MFEKLNYNARAEKFGVIAKIKILLILSLILAWRSTLCMPLSYHLIHRSLIFSGSGGRYVSGTYPISSAVEKEIRRIVEE